MARLRIFRRLMIRVLDERARERALEVLDALPGMLAREGVEGSVRISAGEFEISIKGEEANVDRVFERLLSLLRERMGPLLDEGAAEIVEF